MQEAGTGFASKPQTDDAEPGDIALDSWVRYDDPEVRTFKLNAERQNGRAAMMGVTGCLIHELLGVDALYPTGGLGGAAPPEIVAALAVQGRSGSVQMFSEGQLRLKYRFVKTFEKTFPFFLSVKLLTLRKVSTLAQRLQLFNPTGLKETDSIKFVKADADRFRRYSASHMNTSQYPFANHV